MNESLPNHVTTEELEKIQFVAAIDAVIEELRGNPRVSHPTKMEQVLNTFKANPGGTITTDLLLPLFEGSKDADRQLRVMFSKLNEKLDKYGIKIRHVPGYIVKRTGPEVKIRD